MLDRSSHCSLVLSSFLCSGTWWPHKCLSIAHTPVKLKSISFLNSRTCLKSILSMCSCTFKNKLTLNFYSLMMTMSSHLLVELISPRAQCQSLAAFLAESNLGSNMACICLHMDLPPLPCERFSTAESVWSKRYCSSICSLLLAAPCLPAWWRTRPLVTQRGLSMFNYSSTIGLKCWCRGTAQLHMPLPSPYENVGELQYHH